MPITTQVKHDKKTKTDRIQGTLDLHPDSELNYDE